MTLSEPEFGKRRDIVAVPGGDFDLPADMVIEALGSGNIGAGMGEGVVDALDAGIPVVISTRVRLSWR